MYQSGYYATGYHATGYYLPVTSSIVVDLKSYTHDRFHELIMQEDEELLIIARAFIEILRCR